MAAEDKVYDIYAPILNYKKSITVLNRPAITINWIPREHSRRLKAYEILAALYFNYSRDYRNNPESGAANENDTIWEMGDPAWLCDTIKAKLLGDRFELVIDTPDEIKDLDRLRNAEGADAARIAELDKLKMLLDQRQAYLREWWNDEGVAVKVDENEAKASYLGDCAYMVEWNEDKNAPAIRTYDPGYVFPFYDCDDVSVQEGVKEMVKDRVVIAWEEDSETWKDMDNFFILWHDIYELRVGANGKKSCWRHSAYYKFNSAEKFDLRTLFDSSAMIENTERPWEDLGIDFIPIVVIPNIQVQGADFGISNTHLHIDNFDAIINNDTDLQKNSSYLGGATVGFSGKDVTQAIDPVTKRPEPILISPNTGFALGENGSMTLLDTSRMQTALLETTKYEIDKLIRNTGVTEIGAGKVDSGSLSTLSIMILMRPLLDKIYPMREQRRAHYARLFWMVQRLYQIFGSSEEISLFVDPLYKTTINFGEIVPVNKAERIDYYLKLVDLIGERAALEIARKDGLDINIEQVLADKAQDRAARTKSEADLFNLRMGLNNQGQQE
jgi:hypothetical protein